jgi:hypothetical protein
MSLREHGAGAMRWSVTIAPGGFEMAERRNRKFAMVVGVAFDGEDGHYRQTSGDNFVLVGGSEETHEVMQDKAIHLNEELRRRGKRLEDVESAAELRDILESAR